MQRVNLSASQNEKATNDTVTFTLQGALLGARRIIPLAISAFTVGFVFGVLARQAKLSVVQSLLMSAFVFAGASQFVALTLWIVTPLPVITIILTTFIVNLRHVLMGASLRPWFARLAPSKVYTSVIFVAWVSSTLVGQMVGASIQNPAQWGLDFAFTAVFTALLVGMWKGKSNFLPWAVAAVVAVAAAHWLPGKWYILLGGIAGSVVGAITGAQ